MSMAAIFMACGRILPHAVEKSSRGAALASGGRGGDRSVRPLGRTRAGQRRDRLGKRNGGALAESARALRPRCRPLRARAPRCRGRDRRFAAASPRSSGSSRSRACGPERTRLSATRVLASIVRSAIVSPAWISAMPTPLRPQRPMLGGVAPHPSRFRERFFVGFVHGSPPSPGESEPFRCCCVAARR